MPALIGVTHRTGLMKNGLARMKEALISDSFAAMFGALIAAPYQLYLGAAGVSAAVAD
jgi:xanthine/uracil/vitamin C permease (AzgA family)